MTNQQTQTGGWQRTFNAALLMTTYLLGTTTRKFSNSVTNVGSGAVAAWTGLSMLQGADAGSTTINLQAGIQINTTVDLTQLAGTNNIAGLTIKYPPQLAQSGLKIYPKLIGNYTQSQSLSDYQLLATSKNQVELLSLGIQLPNETLKTTFWGDKQLKWQYQQIGSRIFASSPAIGSDDTVYVGTWDGCLYAIYPNGQLRWRYQTESLIRSSPSISDNGIVYIGSGDQHLYAIYPNGSLKWRYQTTGSVDSGPSISNDGTVYVGSNDQNLYAVYPDGSLKWRYQTTGLIDDSSEADMEEAA